MLSLTHNFLRGALRPSLRPTVQPLATASCARTSSFSTTPPKSLEVKDVTQMMIQEADTSETNFNSRDLDRLKTRTRDDNELRSLAHAHFFKPYDYSYENRLYTQERRRPPRRGPTRKESKIYDVFHNLNLDPLRECQNSSLMSYFVTDMGKIKPRSETKLTWKNQRKLGKAIRRAKMMGIIPVLSKRSLGFMTAGDY